MDRGHRRSHGPAKKLEPTGRAESGARECGRAAPRAGLFGHLPLLSRRALGNKDFTEHDRSPKGLPAYIGPSGSAGAALSETLDDSSEFVAAEPSSNVLPRPF